jgi:hypothetical protein
MLHAKNLPISQQHIQTPFLIKTHKFLEKLSKVGFECGYTWQVFVHILASMQQNIHHASSEQSQDNVTTCFCFHVAYHAPCIIQAKQSKAKPMNVTCFFYRVFLFLILLLSLLFFFLIHKFLNLLIK